MKKIMFLFFLGAAVSAMAQKKEKMAAIETSGKAEITFETDVIDYGKIKQGADGHRVFKFKNTGTEPLIISEVTSSCGCTIAKRPEEPIPQGETGEIEVKYNTNKVGPIRKTITVYSNATTKTKSLKIKGTVLPAEDNKESKDSK